MTLRFDIWGPDVLAANLMESNGVPSRIKVSEKTVEVRSLAATTLSLTLSLSHTHTLIRTRTHGLHSQVRPCVECLWPRMTMVAGLASGARPAVYARPGRGGALGCMRAPHPFP